MSDTTLKRRSFFSFAAAAPAAAMLASSSQAKAASIPECGVVVRTAVTVYVPTDYLSGGWNEPPGERWEKIAQDDVIYEAHNVDICALAHPMSLPADLIPVAVSVPHSWDFHVVIFDGKRKLLDVDTSAFAYGPIDLWHAPVGGLSAIAVPTGTPSAIPARIPITIYCEIDP